MPRSNSLGRVKTGGFLWRDDHGLSRAGLAHRRVCSISIASAYGAALAFDDGRAGARLVQCAAAAAALRPAQRNPSLLDWPAFAMAAVERFFRHDCSSCGGLDHLRRDNVVVASAGAL